MGETANKKRQRGSCDTCGDTYRLLANGKIPTHTSPWNPDHACKGSNLRPEKGTVT